MICGNPFWIIWYYLLSKRVTRIRPITIKIGKTQLGFIETKLFADDERFFFD